MASEPYRKVGRGGAGNYYSSHDVENAAKRIHEDVEAQESVHDTPIENPEAKAAAYAHSGRGGAGNYKPTLSSAAPGVTGITHDISESEKQAAWPQGGHGGRGGAGNFRSVSAERTQAEAEKASKVQEEGYAKAVEDVEKGLKPPEKAHLEKEKQGDPYEILGTPLE